jgi:hypothetical protein
LAVAINNLLVGNKKHSDSVLDVSCDAQRALSLRDRNTRRFATRIKRFQREKVDFLWFAQHFSEGNGRLAPRQREITLASEAQHLVSGAICEQHIVEIGRGDGTATGPNGRRIAARAGCAEAAQ